MTTLTAASRQWAMRPADERYTSTESLHKAALGYREASLRSDVVTSKLRVDHDAKGDVKIIARDHEIGLTNWSFGQLCDVADAPASYMRRLPATMAADCINHGLRQAHDDDSDPTKRLLFKKEHSGMVTLRALTSTKYTRIWNSDVTGRLVELEATTEWQPAPAAFDGSRGLYMGDRDMFGFMVDNNRRIFEKAPGGGLSRGFFVRNSEVGATSFSILTFFYNYICGNHMVWGASGLKEVKIRHVGNADIVAADNLQAELQVYANSSAKEDELRIEKAHTYTIGKDLDAILDKVMGLRINGLNRTNIKAGYELAQKREDWYGAPNTIWGLAGGLTEIARDLPNADERVKMETAAGKLMEIVF